MHFLELPDIGEAEWFWDTSLLPGWTVGWRFGRQANGAVVVRELSIKPEEDPKLKREAERGDVEALVALFTAPVPDGGITSRLLHRLKWRAERIETQRMVETGLSSPPPRTEVKERRPRRGRPPLHRDEWYERLAAAYNRLKPGKKHRLARKFNLSPAAMRSAIRRCREKGLLEPTQQGVAAPRLEPK